MPEQWNTIEIWIVEDNHDYRLKISELFTKEIQDINCESSFSSFEEAEVALKSATLPEPDVILLDIRLPGISGIDALKRFKSRLPASEIVILTTFSDRRNVIEAIRNGASGYLLKTDSINDIARAIREVYDGGSSLNGHVTSMVLKMFSNMKSVLNNHSLTDLELEILQQLSDGQQKKEIAFELNLADYQVNYHVRNIYKKLKVNSLSGAVGKAIRKGLI